MLAQGYKDWARAFSTIQDLGDVLDAEFRKRPNDNEMRLKASHAMSNFMEGGNFTTWFDVVNFNSELTHLLLYRSSRLSSCLLLHVAQNDSELQHLFQECCEFLANHKADHLFFTMLEQVSKTAQISMCTFLTEFEPWKELCDPLLSVLQAASFNDALPFLNLVMDATQDDTTISIITQYPALRFPTIGQNLARNPLSHVENVGQNVIVGVSRKGISDQYLVAYDIRDQKIRWGVLLVNENYNIKYFNKHVVVFYSTIVSIINVQTGKETQHHASLVLHKHYLLPTFDAWYVRRYKQLNLFSMKTQQTTFHCRSFSGSFSTHLYGAVIFDSYHKHVRYNYLDQPAWVEHFEVDACKIIDCKFMWFCQKSHLHLHEFLSNQLKLVVSIPLELKYENTKFLFCDERHVVMQNGCDYLFISRTIVDQNEFAPYLPPVLGCLVMEFIEPYTVSKHYLEFSTTLCMSIACHNAVWFWDRCDNHVHRITPERGVERLDTLECCSSLNACTNKTLFYRP